MGLQLKEAIDTARTILNDPNAVTYSDADLLRYANDALDAIVELAPQYFYERGIVSCVAGEVTQTISFSDARALVSVNRVVGGDVVTFVDRKTLDSYFPNWRTSVAASAIHWMPHVDSPIRFDLYPPSPTGQQVEVTYVRIPGEYTDTQDTGLPTTLRPAITDYIVAMAMSRDDKHVNSQRAQFFLNSFVARVKGVKTGG